MARYSLRSTFRQIWLRIFATIGIITAIAVAYWMKVEDARVTDTPPQIAFGDPVNVGRAVFTPQKLTIETDAAPAATSMRRDRKLILRGRLENATGESQVAILGSPEKLPGISSGGIPFPPPTVYLERDNALLKQLQPRISEAVSIVWDIPEAWQEQDVTIEFSAQQFKLKDNLYGKSSWLLFYPTGALSTRPEDGA